MRIRSFTACLLAVVLLLAGCQTRTPAGGGENSLPGAHPIGSPHRPRWVRRIAARRHRSFPQPGDHAAAHSLSLSVQLFRRPHRSRRHL